MADDFFKLLNLHYDRESLIDFIQTSCLWEDVYSRKQPYSKIDDVQVFRYTEKLFDCLEIKRLASIFDISFDKIQIYNFSKNFSFPPHIDFERKNAILFPILPIHNYNPLIYHFDDYDIPIYYNNPVAVNTQIKHSFEKGVSPRINMQFDLNLDLEEIVDRVSTYNKNSI